MVGSDNMYYLIGERLKECTQEELSNTNKQYVALLTSKEWTDEKHLFKMGIDFEPKTTDIRVTKAEENYDSITGTFFIPKRKDLQSEEDKFAFALDEKGIVFIDDTRASRKIIKKIQRTKNGDFPVLNGSYMIFLMKLLRTIFAYLKDMRMNLTIWKVK